MAPLLAYATVRGSGDSFAFSIDAKFFLVSLFLCQFQHGLMNRCIYLAWWNFQRI